MPQYRKNILTENPRLEVGGRLHDKISVYIPEKFCYGSYKMAYAAV